MHVDVEHNSKDYAWFSNDRVYRYRLARIFKDQDDSRCIFIMLNPSTADAFKNDPTVARCVNFAKSWGHTSLEVLNIFALRSTDPRQLYVHPDPIGPDNTDIIVRSIDHPDVTKVVAAWGSHGALMDMGHIVARMVSRVRTIHALSVTSGGQPGHPLYLKADTSPEVFLCGPDGA